MAMTKRDHVLQEMTNAIYSKWLLERDERDGDGADAYKTALVAYEAAIEAGMIEPDQHDALQRERDQIHADLCHVMTRLEALLGDIHER